MPKFEIKQPEKKGVAKVTFHKESDYKAVKLKRDGQVHLLHHVQADKLIKEKKAEEAKATVKEREVNVSKRKTDKGNVKKS